MKNKIEESYNKCLNLFKEGKRDTEEYRKELENVIDLAKDNTIKNKIEIINLI